MAFGRKVFIFLVLISLFQSPIFADEFCEPEGNFPGLKIPKAILDSGPLLVQTQLNSRSSNHALRGFEDPYGRRKAGLDTAGASLRDQNGNTFDAKLGQYYLLPIRIKYDEYKTLFEGTDSKIKLNVGGQILVPVSQPFGEAAVGVFANINWTKAINEDWAATAGAGLGLNIQKNILGGYQASDQKANVVADGHFAGAVTRFDKDRKGMTSFVVDFGAQTPLLNSNSYIKDNKSTNFLSALGQQASTSLEYGVTVAITRSWGDSSIPDRNSVTIHCKEDFKGKGWAFNGNNNEDFRCGAQYTRKF